MPGYTAKLFVYRLEFSKAVSYADLQVSLFITLPAITCKRRINEKKVLGETEGNQQYTMQTKTQRPVWSVCPVTVLIGGGLVGPGK